MIFPSRLVPMQKMQPLNFVKSICLHASCVPVLKVSLWLGGLANIFVGIIGGTWWPFVTIIALSLHFRLPVPLGMVPPIFDATGNAFVTSMSSVIGALTMLSAYIYMSPIWLISSALFFLKSHRYRRDKATVREKFRSLYLNSENAKTYPLMPFFVRIHPYFLRLYTDADLGGGVRIRRIKPVKTAYRTLSSSIDIWYKEDSKEEKKYSEKESTSKGGGIDSMHTPIIGENNAGDSAVKKPLFFFIHGGGWKGGGARRHTQPALLHRLVLNGWAVVACNYRKRVWPQHVDDCYSALRYLIKEADTLNIDTSRIVISGASAGGQLAALLQARLQADTVIETTTNSWNLQQPIIPSQPVSKNSSLDDFESGNLDAIESKKCTKKDTIYDSKDEFENGEYRIAAMVLFYPAIDPADDANHTTTFPFSIPYFKAKVNQSLMHWFFERVILGDDTSKWHSASVLRMLSESSTLLESWPATMIVHGDLDGIVPVEHSYHFLSSLVLNNENKNDNNVSGDNCVNGVEGGVSGVSKVAEVKEVDRVVSNNGNIGSAVSSSISSEEPITRSSSSSSRNGVSTSSTRLLSERIVTTKKGSEVTIKTESASSSATWRMRKQDVLVTIPGAKHSFEAVGGETLDAVCEGVINWVGRIN